MSRPKLLDLFCCQGGASVGYHRAGFDVYGVDIEPQPRYPYLFHRGNAVELLVHLIEGGGLRFGNEFLHLSDFTAAHGSPPCQAFTRCQKIMGNEHPDLVEPTRFLFQQSGLAWVIENVEGAPLKDPAMLCGGMFGLETYRHRLFEANFSLATPSHPEHVARTTKMGRAPVAGEFMHVVGNFSGVDRAREVMDMPWATRDGLREAIPPAYTEHIGRQLIAHLESEAAA
jgi:DNA (cytosine-5)-methyltransferase 1